MLRRQPPNLATPQAPDPPATFARSIAPKSTATAYNRQSLVSGAAAVTAAFAPTRQASVLAKDKGSATQVLALEKQLYELQRMVYL
jgi:hypothetical protein